MLHVLGALIGLIVVAGLFLAVYGAILRHNMAAVADATGKKQELSFASGWSWLMLKLRGWKTTILAGIAVVPQILANIPTDVMQGWAGLPWAQVFDAKVANIITIVAGLLIPITHSLGLKQAAQTPPVPPSGT